jgi:glycosyltransferase involved in cell wall biosynthesis
MNKNQPKKISIYLGDCAVGGSQRTIINLANTMQEMRIHFELIVGDDTGPAKGWLNADISYISLDVDRQLFALPKMMHYLYHNKPDVLLSSMAHQNVMVLAAAFLARSKTKIFIRETNPPSRVFADRPVLKWLAGKLYPRAAKTIALSARTALELTTELHLTSECIKTIHNPVSIEQSNELIHEKIQITAAGLSEDAFILAVGRLTRQKNFSLLLNSYALAGLQTTLCIVGDGPLINELKEQARNLGIAERVKFIEHSDTVQTLMKAAKFFVLSSSWEGFGHVVVEAMATGTAVIATNCDGPTDIITNGKDGIVIPINDVSALAKQMRKLDRNAKLRAKIGVNGKKRAAYFDRNRVTQEYLDTFAGKE